MSVLLSTIMVIGASCVDVAFASDIEDEYVLEHAGQLKALLKDGIRLSKEELNNPELAFPDVKILKITDTADISNTLPPDIDPKPYDGPQSLLIELTNNSNDYLLEALKILEKDSRILWVGPNGITRITNKDEYVPGQLKTLLVSDVHLSKEELENPEVSFPGINISKIKDLTDLSDILPPEIKPPSYDGPQSLLLELANESDEYLWEAMRVLEKDPRVKWVGPNGIARIAATTPNDPLFSQLWGMSKIQAPNAWDICTGSNSILIGVIDTGTDYNHPDLNTNVDTYLAHSFVSYTNDPMDDHDLRTFGLGYGHGTMVSGIIGAIGNNNEGVTGVNWNVKIVPLKVFNSSGTGSWADIESAILYAHFSNIPILNFSGGGGGYDACVENAIRTYTGLFIAASGNEGWDLNSSAYYPASLNLNNMITVASSNTIDQMSAFSNYGSTKVHLAAPGAAIMSTVPIHLNSYGYAYDSGTSMAAPYVAGAAALLKAKYQNTTTLQLKQALLSSTDYIPSLNGLVYTNGRLNIYKAFNALRIILSRTVTAVGYNHTLAIKSDGSLWAWGSNSSGQLGDGTYTNRLAPIFITDNVVCVAAGLYHTLAVKSDGSLWAWGSNSSGELGDGTSIGRTTPVKIMDDVALVAAGTSHSLAIKSDGSLWTWGYNSHGQLGNGTSVSSKNPVKVMDNVISAAAGGFHSLAIKDDDSLWAWGNNTNGQLGDGTTVTRNTPTKVMDNVVSISGGQEHTLAIKSGFSLWAWGSNTNGQLGDNTSSSNIPVKIMDNTVRMVAGTYYTFAVKNDGSLWTWGQNNYGQLGDGTIINRSTPMSITNSSNLVGANTRHAITVKTDGSLWAWGYNNDGQLGNNSNVSSLIPIQIMTANSISP